MPLIISSTIFLKSRIPLALLVVLNDTFVFPSGFWAIESMNVLFAIRLDFESIEARVPIIVGMTLFFAFIITNLSPQWISSVNLFSLYQFNAFTISFL